MLFSPAVFNSSINRQHSLSACRGQGLCLLIVVGEGVQGKAWTGC